MSVQWRVMLFDGPRLLDAEGNEWRLRSHLAGALLAYLCLHLGKDCSREVIAEALWPDAELDAEIKMRRLRGVLNSLRQELEPVGIAPNSVIDATRAGYIQLRSESVSCDVVSFEAALKRRDKAEAMRLSTGTLLPGFYEEWILAERERLEAIQKELPSATPAVSPQPLPTYLTRFFGRQAELKRLVSALSAARLVTLTGAGGIGKTRLAIETARLWQSEGRGPVAFVVLNDLWEPSGIGRRLLEALNLPFPNSGDALSVLENVLSIHPLLLVFDNFEQLVASGGAVFLGQILATLPGVRCLVTSRRVLDLTGEREVALSPLVLFDARALLADRLQAVRSDFDPEGKQVELEALCRQVDNLPLALELASSRFRVLHLSELARGLAVLERPGRHPGKEDRHLSMHRAIEWSWNLLSRSQQRLFAELSLFCGGWTAAQATELTEEPNAFSLLESLMMDSLVFRLSETEGEEIRFSMLEPLREFAIEKRNRLTDNTALEERFVRMFFALVERETSRDDGDLKVLQREWGNVEAALRIAFEHEMIAEGMTALGAPRFLWQMGRMREGLIWVQRYLTHPLADSQPKKVRFGILRTASTLAGNQGFQEESVAYAQEMCDLAQDLDFDYQIVGLESLLMAFRWRHSTEDKDNAINLRFRIEKIIKEKENSIDPITRLRLFWTLGNDYVITNNYENALQMAERGLSLAKSTGALVWIAQFQLAMGAYLINLARYEEASRFLRTAFDLFYVQHSRHALSFVLENTVRLCLALEDHAGATLLFAASARMRRDDNFHLEDRHKPEYENRLERMRAALSPDVFLQHWERGWETPYEQLSQIFSDIFRPDA
ncbi:MAG: winged helix-turn-helix domain-containing protein [Armatimonas sp.]